MLIVAALVLATLPQPASANDKHWGIDVTLLPAQTKAGQISDFTVTLNNSGDLTVTVCQLDITFAWDTEPQNLFTGAHNIPTGSNWSRVAREAIPPSVTPGIVSATISVTAMTLAEPRCTSHEWFPNFEIVRNLPPTASFDLTPQNPFPNGIVYFTDKSDDPDGIIEAWHWNFGDGTTSDMRHPSHAFAAAGDYSIVLVVRDNNDGSDEESRTVSVSSNLPPLAGFSYALANPDMSVQFSDGSSDPDGFIVEWHWDFDDGTSSDLRHPSHAFPAVGSYEVVLTVTDNEGASNSSSRTVVVGAPAGIEPSPSGFGLLEWGLVGAILASTALVAGILIKRKLRPARRWGQTNTPPPPSDDSPRRWRPR